MSNDPYTEYLRRAWDLYYLDRESEALEYAERALAARPDASEPFAIRAFVATARDDNDAALSAANEVLARAPDSAYSHWVVGRALYWLQRYNDAIAAGRRGIALDPESVPNWRLLAECRIQRSDYKRAEVAARRGLEIDPSDVTCRVVVADALRMTGRLSESLCFARDTVSMHPEEASAHDALARGQLAQGLYRTATARFLDALRLNPNRDGTRRELRDAVRRQHLGGQRVNDWLVRYRRRPVASRVSHSAGGWWFVYVLWWLSPVFPQLSLVAWPLTIANITFFVFVWGADIIADSLAWLHPETRALIDRTARARTVVGLILLATSVVAGGHAAVTSQTFGLHLGMTAIVSIQFVDELFGRSNDVGLRRAIFGGGMAFAGLSLWGVHAATVGSSLRTWSFVGYGAYVTLALLVGLWAEMIDDECNRLRVEMIGDECN